MKKINAKSDTTNPNNAVVQIAEFASVKKFEKA
jgi:hypothetical protein